MQNFDASRTWGIEFATKDKFANLPSDLLSATYMAYLAQRFSVVMAFGLHFQHLCTRFSGSVADAVIRRYKGSGHKKDQPLSASGLRRAVM